MSLDTYANLQTEIANFLHRSDLTSEIPTFITLAETRIYRELRTSDMEASFSGAISSGSLALPSAYLDLKFAYINSSPVQWLERKSNQWIYKTYPVRSASDLPKTIAREGTSFIFGPYPDSGYTVNGIYYKSLGALSASAHALFVANPDIYLFGALCEAEPYMIRDARIAIWKAKYNEIRDQINLANQREDHSGGALRMTAR